MALIVVVLIMIMVIPVTVAVLFVFPMSFMQLPALLVVIVVRVAPGGAFVGGTVPASLNPAVVMAVGNPISFDPGIAWAGDWSANLNAKRGGRGSDVHRNLS